MRGRSGISRGMEPFPRLSGVLRANLSLRSGFILTRGKTQLTEGWFAWLRSRFPSPAASTSSLGKGITAASLGRLLKARGYTVAIQKFDPYLNVDPGTMNPYQHGEVFVTEDGAETDLDLGHYERFIDENLTRYSSVTSGQVYFSVLNARARAAATSAAPCRSSPTSPTRSRKSFYPRRRRTADVVITEIGGTVGDIEGQPFIEAIRQIPMGGAPASDTPVHPRHARSPT